MWGRMGAQLEQGHDGSFSVCLQEIGVRFFLDVIPFSDGYGSLESDFLLYLCQVDLFAFLA